MVIADGSARVGPNVEAYLAQLPHGLASHPQCTVKASVVREIVDLVGNRDQILNASPPEIKAEMASLPPVTSWISEVHANALFAAILDGPCRGDERELLRLIHEGNVRLFKSPLYRALFWLVPVDRVVGGAASRWTHLRRGSELVVEDQRKGAARLVLTYPTHLWPAFMLRMRAVTFADVLTVAGAKDARVDVESAEPTRAVFVGRWS